MKIKLSNLNNDLGGFRFGISEDGTEYGYIITDSEGADTLIPFKNLETSTPGTATAEHITEGFTAWVNGELITGTRPQAPNTLSGSGSTWKDWDQMTMTGSVTFSTPFDTIPTVSAYVSYAHDGGYGVTGKFSMSVSNVTRSGFNWKITTSSWEKPAFISSIPRIPEVVDKINLKFGYWFLKYSSNIELLIIISLSPLSDNVKI